MAKNRLAERLNRSLTVPVKTDGNIIKSTSNKDYKNNFFKYLEIQTEDYSDIAFTEDELDLIRKHLSHLSTGASAAIVLVCPGKTDCSFSGRCPFAIVNKTPTSKKCLVELNLMNEWTRLYAEEYNIPDNSFTELQTVRELAEVELLLWRINNKLSLPEYATLVDDVCVGVTKQGDEITKLEPNAYLLTKEKLINRKSRLIKLMVGDRQEKYKREAALRIREEQDPSTSSAELRSNIQKLLKQAEVNVLKLKETEGNIIDITTPLPEDVDLQEAEKPLSPEDFITSEIENR